jgi:RNA polymerase sigma factor (sigma-70 family)
MQNSTLSELYLKAAGGNRAAESELIEILRVRFMILAKLRVGGTDAEDLVQEACMTVIQKYKSIPDYNQFLPWAHTVLRNKIGNYITGSRRRKRIFVDSAKGETVGREANASSIILLETKIVECLKKIGYINKRYPRILNLVHLGYNADEISRRLNLNKKHLYVLLNRGRSLLADCLEKDDE